MCNDPIRHGAIDYKEIKLDACESLVSGLVGEHKPWHSHVLSPGCAFNPFDGRYAIVVEDDRDHVAYIAASDGFPDVDKLFVKILHGDDILDETVVDRDVLLRGSDLLRRVDEIDGRRVKWHHHMNFPACQLNPHRGTWAITIESDEGTFSETYKDEPKDVLREIEVLYFRNLANSKV